MPDVGRCLSRNRWCVKKQLYAVDLGAKQHDGQGARDELLIEIETLDGRLHLERSLFGPVITLPWPSSLVTVQATPARLVTRHNNSGLPSPYRMVMEQAYKVSTRPGLWCEGTPELQNGPRNQLPAVKRKELLLMFVRNLPRSAHSMAGLVTIHGGWQLQVIAESPTHRL